MEYFDCLFSSLRICPRGPMLSIRETVSLKIAENSRAASRRSSETDEKYAACQHRHETQCKIDASCNRFNRMLFKVSYFWHTNLYTRWYCYLLSISSFERANHCTSLICLFSTFRFCLFRFAGVGKTA